MAALKIIAALFIVGVAQTSAATLSRDKPFQDEYKLVAKTSGVQSTRNPLECMAYFPEAYAVIQEIRGLWTNYKEVQEINMLEKAKCAEEEEDEREMCIRDADEALSRATDQLLEQAKLLIPKITKVLWSFKTCLFD